MIRTNYFCIPNALISAAFHVLAKIILTVTYYAAPEYTETILFHIFFDVVFFNALTLMISRLESNDITKAHWHTYGMMSSWTELFAVLRLRRFEQHFFHVRLSRKDALCCEIYAMPLLKVCSTSL